MCVYMPGLRDGIYLEIDMFTNESCESVMCRLLVLSYASPAPLTRWQHLAFACGIGMECGMKL